MEYANLNIYQYLGEKGLRLMEYDQNYHSDNYSSLSEKELYWKKESDDQWRIIFDNS